MHNANVRGFLMGMEHVIQIGLTIFLSHHKRAILRHKTVEQDVQCNTCGRSLKGE